jgi:2-polyprenyl-6-methoxyphenol hydroxylase-like FAD-dependent oxidoreductase
LIVEELMAIDNRCGWIALAGEAAAHPRLNGNRTADWLIIGGGITGLAAAHTLAARFPGQRVVLLDRQRVAQALRRATRGSPSAMKSLGTASCWASPASPISPSPRASVWRQARRCASASVNWALPANTMTPATTSR